MRYNKSILGFFIAFIIFSHCAQQPADRSDIPIREYSIQSVLWLQNAAEYRALSYQSYRLARLQLDRFLSEKKSAPNKAAIVTDLDETVLDNSPFNAKLIEIDANFSAERWLEWSNLAEAEAIPGALAFYNYAASRGVEVFYISNRMVREQQKTIANLKKLGLPYADDTHVLLKEKSSGKESRREKVSASHEIVLLLGDNLSDFSDLFDRQGSQRRNVLADSMQGEFGTKFIIFANPMYGDWESKGIYEGRYDWSKTQSDSIRRGKIRAY